LRRHLAPDERKISGMGKTLTEKELDFQFKYRIMREKGGEKIVRCFSCATCSLSCPVRAVDEEFNPRRIIRLALLGAKEEVLRSPFIWLCSACYLCSERCPQDVKITDLMTALRNIAVEEGILPSSLQAQLDLLYKHGRLYEIGEFENKKRSKQLLPALEEKKESVISILELLNLNSLIPEEK
jgi:heterodisulfide reductase subunit C